MNAPHCHGTQCSNLLRILLFCSVKFAGKARFDHSTASFWIRSFVSFIFIWHTEEMWSISKDINFSLGRFNSSLDFTFYCAIPPAINFTRHSGLLDFANWLCCELTPFCTLAPFNADSLMCGFELCISSRLQVRIWFIHRRKEKGLSGVWSLCF